MRKQKCPPLYLCICEQLNCKHVRIERIFDKKDRDLITLRCYKCKIRIGSLDVKSTIENGEEQDCYEPVIENFIKDDISRGEGNDSSIKSLKKWGCIHTKVFQQMIAIERL